MPDQNPDEELHKAYSIAMRKGRERYVFVFDEASFDETSRTFARFANDRDLFFCLARCNCSWRVFTKAQS
jgi:hypothetical protein